MMVRVSISNLLLLISLLSPGREAFAQPPTPVLMPPIPSSPIADFRRWLKMESNEREKALADYPEKNRDILRKKLLAYESMPTEQREHRLQMLELRWHLLPLMHTAPTERGDYLQTIPPRLHDVVVSRLRHWDSLSPETRRDILADDRTRELVTGYFSHLRRNPGNAPEIRANDPRRSELRAALNRWHEASPEDRRKMGTQLTGFLDLRSDEQHKTLGRFSEKERAEIEKTLSAYQRLSPKDRRVCVDSFQKLATMSPEERAGFLRNAARWQQMTQEERETWKRLVNMVPPMPPQPVIPPPMPLEARSTTRSLATNSAGAPLLPN